MMKRLVKSRYWAWLWRSMLIVFVGWLIFVVGLVGNIHLTGNRDNAQEADVIIVLGAGFNRDGTVGSALWRRSYRAAQLWHEGYADVIICTGGQSANQQRSEASGCQEVLLGEGVSPQAITLEENSRSTEENAIHSRDIMEANDWQTAILVSDSFHVLRANLIFELHEFDVVLSPVPSRWLRKSFYLPMVGREVVALHWQFVKDLLNLPFTQVPILAIYNKP
ncbi:MAG: YdcF family protein [Anaerolineae bacterium]|nr:YdcF family protein [Anaerolineae bacterium]